MKFLEFSLGNRIERIWKIAQVDFKKRYYNDRLGLAWALINPIFRVAIFYLVFAVVLKLREVYPLYHLFNFYRASQRTGKNNPWAILPKHPFYHQMTGEKEMSLIEQCRAMVLDYFDAKESPKVFGFKEIRYFDIIEDTPSYLHFLKRVMPNPLFVFLERDLEEVVQSAWWKDNHPDQIKLKFRQLYQSFDQFKAKHPQKSYSIAYQDLTQKSARLKGLFDRIGAHYDPDLIDFVLSVPHSYAPKEKNKAHHFKDFPI